MPTRNFFANSGSAGVTTRTLPGYPYGQYTSTTGNFRRGWWHRKRTWENRLHLEDKSTHNYNDEYLRIQGNPFNFDKEVKNGSNWIPMYQVSGETVPYELERRCLTVLPMAAYQLEIPMNKVLEKVAGATWDVPTFTAELAETSKMIYGAAKSLAKGYAAVKKGNFLLAAKELGCRAPTRKELKFLKNKGNPKDAWMGMRYGWMPTVYDVCDAAEFTASKLLPDEIQPQFFEHQMHHTHVDAGFSVGPEWSFGIGDSAQCSWHITHTTSVRAYMRVKVASDRARTMAQLGFADCRTTAWELLPLSFVVDWFVQVGDYLKLSSALRGLTVVDAGYSILHVADGRASVVRSDAGIGQRFGRGLYPSGSCNVRQYRRYKWTDFSPRLTTSPPDKLSVKRMADAICLLSNVFK